MIKYIEPFEEKLKISFSSQIQFREKIDFESLVEKALKNAIKRFEKSELENLVLKIKTELEDLIIKKFNINNQSADQLSDSELLSLELQTVTVLLRGIGIEKMAHSMNCGLSLLVKKHLQKEEISYDIAKAIDQHTTAFQQECALIIQTGTSSNISKKFNTIQGIL